MGRVVLLYVAWRHKMEPMSLTLRGMEGEAVREEPKTRKNHHRDGVEAREKGKGRAEGRRRMYGEIGKLA